MKLVTPRSDQGKLELLQGILAEVTAPNSCVATLPNDLFEALFSIHEQFAAQHKALLLAREAWHHSLLIRGRKLRQLEFLLRDAFSQIKRRGRKVNLPAQIYEMFDLSEQGTQSLAVRQLRAPIELSKSLFVALEQAAKQGFVLLHGDDLAELRNATDALVLAQQVRVAARNRERVALTEMRGLRAQVHELLLRLKLFVRLSCVGAHAEHQRQCFLALGFSYRGLEVERKAEGEARQQQNASSEIDATALEAEQMDAKEAKTSPWLATPVAFEQALARRSHVALGGRVATSEICGGWLAIVARADPPSSFAS